MYFLFYFFFFQAEDGIRDRNVTGVQTCALPICMTMNGSSLIPIAIACVTVILTGCQTSLPPEIKVHHGESFGSIEVLDSKLNSLIAPGTPIEKLASGFDWSEGPVWIKPGNAPLNSGPLSVRQGGYLLFSDVPSNTVYRWSATDGVSIFLKPSG